MKLILKKGEYKWSAEGTHICDERGFAIVCEEDCEVEIPQPELFERASKTVAEDRKLRGVAPSFSIPATEEPAPVTEAEAAPAEPSSTESAPPAPEALPEQPAPEESAPAHVEPAPQEHGQESSASPETPVAAEESAQDQPAP